MGHQVIKQPNGLLAIYSDGVDGGCWLRWDMSEVDVEDYYAERAATSARASARETVNSVMADEALSAYDMTFVEANTQNAVYHADQGPGGPVDEQLLEKLKYPDDWQDNAS